MIIQDDLRRTFEIFVSERTIANSQAIFQQGYLSPLYKEAASPRMEDCIANLQSCKSTARGCPPNTTPTLRIHLKKNQFFGSDERGLVI